MESLFKKTPTQKELSNILKKMTQSMGLKKHKNNPIISLSILKFSNITVEFFLLKDELSEYYNDNIIQTKFKNDNIINIINVYNDFFKLDNYIISEFNPINNNIDNNFNIKKQDKNKLDKKKEHQKKNKNNQHNNKSIYYKIYSIIDYYNLIKDKNKIQENKFVITF